MVLLNISSDPFFIYKKCMRLCGVWPLDGFKSTSVIVNAVFLVIEMTLILLPLTGLLPKCASISYQVITTISLITMTVLRLTMRLYGGRSVPLIESTIEDWSSITDPTERTIMKQHDKSGTYIFLATIVLWLPCTYVHEVIALALPNTPETFNYRLDCTRNDTTITNNAVAVLYIAVGNIETLSYCSSISLFWSLAMHLCGQYRILKQQFVEFLLIKDKKERRREFHRLVNRHNHLLDLNGKLEDSFNILVAFDCLGVQIFICGQASQLGYAIKNYDPTGMAEAILYIALNIPPLFLYCYISDYLTTCNQEIGEVFTQCNWYDLSKESIMDFSIVIAGSRMPTDITAAKLCKLNLDYFKYALKANYSYVSLIVALIND